MKIHRSFFYAWKTRIIWIPAGRTVIQKLEKELARTGYSINAMATHGNEEIGEKYRFQDHAYIIRLHMDSDKAGYIRVSREMLHRQNLKNLNQDEYCLRDMDGIFEEFLGWTPEKETGEDFLSPARKSGNVRLVDISESGYNEFII